MNSEELQIFKNKILNKEIYLRKDQIDTKYIEIKDDLLSYPGKDFDEKKYNFLRNILEIPFCKGCGINRVSFINTSYGYSTYCSKECNAKNVRDSKANRTREEIVLENSKRKKTVKEKYGEEFEHISQVPEKREKFKITCNEKYGGDAPTSSKEVIATRQKNNMERWGVSEYSQTQEWKEKVAETNLEHWGFKSHFQHPDYVKISQDALEDKYGVRYPYQNKEIRDKANEKAIISIKTPEAQEKHRNTIFNKNKEFLINKYQNLISIDKYEIIDLTINEGFIIKHNDGHIFNIKRGLIADRIRWGCSELSLVLNPIGSHTSSHEIELRSFLDDLNIEYQHNTRKILEKNELDIYIPTYKLALEINGLYWHSTEYQDDKKYHLNKVNECKSLGIDLFHIYEDDWIYKKEIVKSMIKNKLNMTENKIYARKCEIREVSYKDSLHFLVKNHIQGNTISSIRLGLYNNNNELVSLMIFKNNRKKECELLRFCSKLNTSVIGGASRLFSYFIKTYENINEVVSFSNIDSFNGSMYETLGFEFVHTTPPDYHWIIDNRRKHKSLFKKHILVARGFDPNKSEVEIMEEQGYHRIYSSGLIKWKYIKKYES